MSSSDTPLVSVVTPSFNKGRFIEETIRSVLSQDYPRIEYIIIDGGSTDGTRAILEKYSRKIAFVSEPDKGQSDAINKGWRLAKGDILAYLNADDTYTPGAVRAAVESFSKNPDAGLVYGDGILTDESGRVISTHSAGEFSLRDLLYCRDNILQPAVFIRRAVYDRIGGIDEELPLAMDLDYWIRTGLLFPAVYTRQPLATAKIYAEAKSAALMHQYVSDYDHILAKVFADPNLPPGLAHEKNAIYTYVYTKGALDYLHLGMVREGLSMLWKAFWLNPSRCIADTFILIGQSGLRKLRRSV